VPAGALRAGATPRGRAPGHGVRSSGVAHHLEAEHAGDVASRRLSCRREPGRPAGGQLDHVVVLARTAPGPAPGKPPASTASTPIGSPAWHGGGELVQPLVPRCGRSASRPRRKALDHPDHHRAKPAPRPRTRLTRPNPPRRPRREPAGTVEPAHPARQPGHQARLHAQTSHSRRLRPPTQDHETSRPGRNVTPPSAAWCAVVCRQEARPASAEVALGKPPVTS